MARASPAADPGTRLPPSAFLRERRRTARGHRRASEDRSRPSVDTFIDSRSNRAREHKPAALRIHWTCTRTGRPGELALGFLGSCVSQGFRCALGEIQFPDVVSGHRIERVKNDDAFVRRPIGRVHAEPRSRGAAVRPHCQWLSSRTGRAARDDSIESNERPRLVTRSGWHRSVKTR